MKCSTTEIALLPKLQSGTENMPPFLSRISRLTIESSLHRRAVYKRHPIF